MWYSAEQAVVLLQTGQYRKKDSIEKVYKHNPFLLSLKAPKSDMSAAGNSVRVQIIETTAE
eukprot:1340-Heterococcus_DN1.PRE.6